MASSYLNIVTFLLTTLTYYLTIKPNLTYEIASNGEQYKTYISNSYMYLAIYFLLVLIVQFFVNSSVISSMCGGSVSENMGAAGVYTFLPWTLIFGVLIIIITIYPGFKSAFSDVVGYFWVASSANKIITDLLVNPDLEKFLNRNEDEEHAEFIKRNASAPGIDDFNAEPGIEMTNFKPSPSQKGGDTTKEQMQEAADLIIKICGNSSILINQIVPSNFDTYWNILKPLMKEKYQDDASRQTKDIKNDLFEVVVTRDNVGEAMWYIYTGVLLTAIVQLKITSRGCVSSSKTMEENYQKFKEAEKKAQEEKELATSTTYTMTN
jgi:hypothetical protein